MEDQIATNREFEGYKILVAEDEEITREVTASLVEDFGAKCETVKDGEELLERLNAPGDDEFDLVLTDINMPRKSGIDACSEFRASSHPKAKTLPILGMSSDTNRSIFDRAISAGMNGMTMKPVSRAAIYSHFTLTLKDNRANAVFCERVQQAIDAAKAKSYFFSTVSHDIRTPLNAIIGFSQMLKMGFNSREEQDQALDSIMLSGKTLLQLINDILDLSMLESGSVTLNTEPIDCAKLLGEIVESFRVANKKPDVALRTKIDDIPLLELDPYRLRQIAFNFFANALKYTERGFVEMRASFEYDAAAGDGTLTLAVEDTGIGISEEDQKRIDSPYVQVGSKLERNGGTGLGLAICRQLAGAMGGSMSLKSQLGVGTTFTVVIPHVKVDGPAAAAARAPAKGEPAATPQASAPAKRELSRVMVVDDSKVNIFVLKAMLARLGVVDIITAMDGEEAFAKLTAPDAQPVDIVLTDMWMPKMNGEALVKAIRAAPKLAGTPVYAVTADIEIRNSHKDLGFTDILLKPVTIDVLKNMLAAYRSPAAV